MTPWDLIVWSFAAGISAVIAGLGIATAVLLITIARGKL